MTLLQTTKHTVAQCEFEQRCKHACAKVTCSKKLLS